MSHGVVAPSSLLSSATTTLALCLSRHALGRPASALETPVITPYDKWYRTMRVDGSPGMTRVSINIRTKKVDGRSSRGSRGGRPCGRNDSRKRSSSGWLAARSVRGGCTSGRGGLRRHRRAARPTKSFVAPALVWVFAATVDYDLWWRQGGAAASALLSIPDDGNSPRKSAWSCVTKIFQTCGGHFVLFHVLLGLALLSHAAATAADPGFFAGENGARSTGRAQPQEPGRWCDHCEAYKPPRAHHCRRCKACVARMDHHCIFVANCVGAGNHKELILFVSYSLACAAHATSLYLRLCLPRSRGSDLEHALLRSVGSGRRSPARRGAAVVVGFLFVSVVFLAAVLTQQCRGVVADAGVVDRMQAAAAAETARMEQPTQPGYHLGADAAGGFQAAVGLQRGPFGGEAALGDASCSGRARRRFGSAKKGLGAGLVRLGRRWRDFRQEILGEGPWFMWFLPTPAMFSVEAEERIYWPHGKAARNRSGCSS